jgi:hypothetical protein
LLASLGQQPTLCAHLGLSHIALFAPMIGCLLRKRLCKCLMADWPAGRSSCQTAIRSIQLHPTLSAHLFSGQSNAVQLASRIGCLLRSCLCMCLCKRLMADWPAGELSCQTAIRSIQLHPTLSAHLLAVNPMQHRWLLGLAACSVSVFVGNSVSASWQTGQQVGLSARQPYEVCSCIHPSQPTF